MEAVRFDGPIMDIEELEANKDCELIIETCITRTLPPALTLERGLRSVKEAVEELKLNAPPCSSGIFRFQVVFWFRYVKLVENFNLHCDCFVCLFAGRCAS